MVKKVAIIQARLSSTRFPGKILNDLCGKTLLERVVNRVERSGLIDEVWLATSTDPTDDIVELFANEIDIKVHRGSLDNVLERFCEVAAKSNADIIVRVTGDNPLTEARFIDEGISKILESGCDYLYYEDIPYGSGVEIIRKNALIKAQKSTIQKDCLEHVTLYIRENQHLFKTATILPPLQLRRPDIKVTVDTLEEYILMYKVHYHLKDKIENNQQLILEEAIKLIDNNIV